MIGNKLVIGLNAKHMQITRIVSILPLILLLLPFISFSKNGKYISGFTFSKRIMEDISNKEISAVLVFLLVTTLLIEILIFINGIFAFIKPGRPSMNAAIALFTVYLVLMILFMFRIKKFVDGSWDYSDPFLIKYMGPGYWLGLLTGFVGLYSSLKSMKKNPGYILLTILSIAWLFPILWIVLASLRGEGNFYVGYFWPKEFTLDNYKDLFNEESENNIVHFKVMWFNTFKVAAASCIINTLIVVGTAFTLSRHRFKGRQKLMNAMLIIGMFPGFMAMIAVYNILKGIGLAQTLVALVVVSAAGAAMGYYVCKGYFDTISKSIDEAATIDGATKFQIFTKITLPLSKPIIVYTVLGSFIAPWTDYIFPSLLLGDNKAKSTVAIGLRWMTDAQRIETYYKQFAAGAVIVSIPIIILFVVMQRYYVEGLSGSTKG